MEDLDRLKEIDRDNAILRNRLASLRAEAIRAWNRNDKRALFRISFLEAQINRVMGRDITQKV